MKPVAHFDMDGSLFDYEGQLRADLNKMRFPTEPEIDNLWEAEKSPWMKSRMDAIKSIPGWWRKLPPLQNGFIIYNLAKSLGFDCRILTKGPKSKPLAWMEKLECCQSYFGEKIDVDITSDKGKIYGKVLYDDFPDYMEAWLKHRPRGLGIMPVTRTNADFMHPNVIKWDGTNFDDVLRALTVIIATSGKTRECSSL